MFTLFAVKNSLAYDEEALYQESQVTLILTSPQQNSFQILDQIQFYSLYLAMIAVFVMAVFQLFVPEHVKDSIMPSKKERNRV